MGGEGYQQLPASVPDSKLSIFEGKYPFAPGQEPSGLRSDAFNQEAYDAAIARLTSQLK